MGIKSLGIVLLLGAALVMFKMGFFSGSEAEEESVNHDISGLSVNVPEASVVPNGSEAKDVPSHLQSTIGTGPGVLSPIEEEVRSQLLFRFNAGDYGAALRIAEENLNNPELSSTYKSWVEKQMPVILTSEGWLKLNLGKCDDAIDFFERAVRMSPLPEAYKGLGICKFKAKEYDAADEFLSRYLAEQPDDLNTLLVKADVLEGLGNFSGSAEILGNILNLKVIEDQNVKLALQKRLASMKSRNQESYQQQQFQSEYYKVSYRGGEHEEVLNFVIRSLDGLVDEYHFRWGLEPPQMPIEIMLYPDNAFQALVSYSPRWASGLYDGRIRIPITKEFRGGAGLDRLKRILRHEMFHAIIAEQVDRRELPPWFNEGLAQYLECEQGCGFQFSSVPGRFLNVDSFNTPFVRYDQIKAKSAYEQSLFLMRIIALDGDEAISRIIRSLNKSSILKSDAILQSVGMSFAGLRDRAEFYWKKKQSL